MLSAEKTIDFAAIATDANVTETVSVPGAEVGDTAIVMPVDSTLDGGVSLSARVSAADTVEIAATAMSAAGVDPASRDYRVIVFKAA